MPIMGNRLPIFGTKLQLIVKNHAGFVFIWPVLNWPSKKQVHCFKTFLKEEETDWAIWIFRVFNQHLKYYVSEHFNLSFCSILSIFVRISWTFYSYFADFSCNFARFWLGICAVCRLLWLFHENLSKFNRNKIHLDKILIKKEIII